MHLKFDLRKTKTFMFLVLSIFTSSLYGQSISGSLIDMNSGEPISFAYILASQSKKATISNENGDFEISGLSIGQDTLIISHLAYYTIKRPISVEPIMTIHLDPREIVLDEISVTDVPVQDIALCVLNVLKNSSIEYGKAFYRQTASIDSKATEWIEAFYDIAYSANGIDKLKIDQARFARIRYDSTNLFMSFTNFSYLTVANSIYSAVTGNDHSRIAKPFGEHFFKDYDFYLDKQYTLDSNRYVVIEFQPSSKLVNPIFSFGKFVFNVTQNKLLQYTAEINHALGTDEFTADSRKDIELKNPKHFFQFNFSEISGNIDAIQVDYSYDLIYNGKVLPSRVSSKFLVYQLLDKEPKGLRSAGLELEDVSNFENAKYKPKFWMNNPVIKRTIEEEAIIASFDKNNAFGTYFK
ncbi:carboxypeptidase-like regulatory domain-containing protein [Aquiflexum sp. LQ15W]|uniref:carboxypeptidase-like regulatory domain-containing protein n=1 Tax=Cognataquiflexum nitidum TaxID=2922272 RepID=UPI001F137CD8|nr:carboxypeptidase-like regulatory domain-containing protein [Cognataquiflexum nitidum]MCH6198279.1 carboxypeptidase-like regulatory domain-containing protein [Cognataquiflexum nitidum]